jgi:hypothetical protein
MEQDLDCDVRHTHPESDPRLCEDCFMYCECPDAEKRDIRERCDAFERGDVR